MLKILIPIADGNEDIEAIAIYDILSRTGAELTLASIMPSKRVTTLRDLIIEAPSSLVECLDTTWDLIALPGGKEGAERMHDSRPLMTLIREQLESGRWLGAICTAPVIILGRHGLISDYRATCYQTFRSELSQYVREASEQRVVVDRNLITSQSPGTAIEFAFQLVSCVFGEEQSRSIARTVNAYLPPG
ncbi:DJ-1 family glyoxalase III [Microbulbifer sp. GL-2]|uniref:DJ-1 family glyoxalase III n=1 Tax=Microbulbifer sp. GL-2 TaxID=2591606 RepID=UPI0011621BAE|nr:DJ-1 family glyoxalase III [Microbulbifer sp. GL-2]BBM03404.1 4-methyl-5(B-hydroxyethyl)-thiazole monophosphate biosynthesis protein [Microbulbifer sp. GL-2]